MIFHLIAVQVAPFASNDKFLNMFIKQLKVYHYCAKVKTNQTNSIRHAMYTLSITHPCLDGNK